MVGTALLTALLWGMRSACAIELKHERNRQKDRACPCVRVSERAHPNVRDNLALRRGTWGGMWLAAEEYGKRAAGWGGGARKKRVSNF